MEYYVRFYCAPVINLVVYFHFLVDMEPFHCVKNFPFCGDVWSVYDSVYGAYGMVVIKEVLRKFGFVVSVYEVANMFAESDRKRPTTLSDICFFAIGTGQFVYSRLSKFVLMLDCLLRVICL
jgi:hypothetical protein